LDSQHQLLAGSNCRSRRREKDSAGQPARGHWDCFLVNRWRRRGLTGAPWLAAAPMLGVAWV
jgi:hypothetical protein